MSTPIHSINIDFSHSSEAIALLQVINSGEFPRYAGEFVLRVVGELQEAIEMLEALEG